MKSSPGLRELERKVWLRTFEHGLWDLAIGLLLLSFGVGVLTQIYWVSAILVPLAFPAMRDLARRAIVPRIGHAAFRGRRGRSMVHVQALLGALAVMGIGAFAFQSLSGRAQVPGWIAWTRVHFIIVIGVIWGGALAIAGWVVDFPRLYAYGVVLLGSLVATDLLPTDYNFGHALVGVGALIALIGVALFIRFIRRYPRQGGPDIGKADG